MCLHTYIHMYTCILFTKVYLCVCEFVIIFFNCKNIPICLVFVSFRFGCYFCLYFALTGRITSAGSVSNCFVMEEQLAKTRVEARLAID